MKKVIIGLIAILLLVSISCSVAPSPELTPIPPSEPVPTPTPKATPTPVPMPTPVFTNSESDSSVAELEAEIRQLESENQRLILENQQFSSDLAAMTAMTEQLELDNQRIKTENQQLTSELVTVTSVLQNVQSMAYSTSYANTLGGLNDVQAKASELAYFAGGLPHLPPLPPGITVARINDAIIKARKLRDILQVLPPPPPLAPSWWWELDDMKNAFIDMTEWMEDLRNIPEFLESSESLDELRSRVEGYLDQVQNTVSDAEGTLEQIRDAASP
jgi:hypothetical protein